VSASGKLTHSEELGFGEEKFQRWMMSAVLLSFARHSDSLSDPEQQ